MPQIKNSLIVLLLTILVFIVSGCGTQNDAVTFDPDAQRHPQGWLPAGHVAAAQADIDSCGSCHGSDFAGGISGVSCAACHLGGAASVHPVNWRNNALLNHRWYAFQNGSDSCANLYCHGANLSGVAQSGPACDACHVPVPSSANCSICHGFPPAGTLSPNVAGKHEKHTALPGADCSICHENKIHANTVVNVNFQSLYSAKSGSAGFDPGTNTCSNVICHGGQTTPSWLTGTIAVNTQCTACHSYGTAEYNSFASGKHDRHVNSLGQACTVCHDTAKLAVNHFTALNTQIMEGPASATLKAALGYSGTTCGTPGCHGSRSWW